MKAKPHYVKWLGSSLLVGALVMSIAACSQGTKTASTNTKAVTLSEIEQLAKQEGQVVSVGMPDSWANWKGTWTDLQGKYGLKHSDTDMSSAEELAKFEAEKNKPTADIGDVGVSFGPLAAQKGLTLPYKTSYWNQIPDWAKDKDGNWVVGYQGAIAVIINKDLVKNPPKTWDDILKGDYKVAVGDVTKASQAQNAVLAAALTHGGSESNIQPGIDYFATLAKQGRLSLSDVKVANFEKGEVPVAFVWDFNGLGYRDQLDPKKFEVRILSEGSVVSGYCTIINKYAPHPNAAKLTREYILSDQGQINLAKGYARPIRDNVQLPADVASKLLPKEQYANVKPIKDYAAWDKTVTQLPQLWQEQVLVNVK